jgi:hypothetical protein
VESDDEHAVTRHRPPESRSQIAEGMQTVGVSRRRAKSRELPLQALSLAAVGRANSRRGAHEL